MRAGSDLSLDIISTTINKILAKRIITLSLYIQKGGNIGEKNYPRNCSFFDHRIKITCENDREVDRRVHLFWEIRLDYLSLLVLAANFSTT